MWRSFTRCGYAAATLPPPTPAPTAMQCSVSSSPSAACARGPSAAGHVRHALATPRVHTGMGAAASAVCCAALTAQRSSVHTPPSDVEPDRAAATAAETVDGGVPQPQTHPHRPRLTRHGRTAKRATVTPADTADEEACSASSPPTQQPSGGGDGGGRRAGRAVVSRPASARFQQQQQQQQQQPGAPSRAASADSTTPNVDLVKWDLELLASERVVPTAPTPENATYDSVISHLRTLRRSVSLYRTGTRSFFVLRRSIELFLEVQLPMIMKQPPVPASYMHLVAAGKPPHSLATPPAPQPRNPHPRGFFKKRGLAPTVVANLERSGTGPLAWQVEIAEAVLFTCEKTNTAMTRLWCCRAALLFLMAREEAAAATPAQTPPPSRPSMTTEQWSDRAQLAVALLRVLTRERARRAFDDSVRESRTAVVVAKAALSRWGRGSKDGAAHSASGPARLSGVDATAPPSTATAATSAPASSSSSSFIAAALATSAAWTYEGSFDVDDSAAHYLATSLLPEVYAEFKRFCEALEQRYDSAAAAAAAVPPPPPPPAQTRHTELHRAALPVMNSVELELFSSLCAVIGRAASLGCLRRRGGDVQFHVRAPTTTATPWSSLAQPALSSRAFAVTLTAIAAQLDASAGPRSGELEAVLGRAWTTQTLLPTVHNTVAPLSLSAVRGTGQSASGRTHRGGGAAAGRKSRFTSSTTAAASTKQAAHGTGHNSSSSNWSRGGRSSPIPGSASAAPPATDNAAIFTTFGNFNLAHVIPVLQLCLSTHALGRLLRHPPAASVDTGEAAAAVVALIADAVASMTLLAVHWAPVCRSYQLLSVVGFYATAVGAQHAPRAAHKRAGGARAAAVAASHDDEGLEHVDAVERDDVAEAATAPPRSLDAAVLARVRQRVLPRADNDDDKDGAAAAAALVDEQVTQQLRRLCVASHSYIERLHPSAVSSILGTMCRVLMFWPTATAGPERSAAALPGVAHSSSSSSSSSSNYSTGRLTAGAVLDAPLDVGVPLVLLIIKLAAEWWARQRGREAWRVLSLATCGGKVEDYYERVTATTPGRDLSPTGNALSFAAIASVARLPEIAARVRELASCPAEAEEVLAALIRYGTEDNERPLGGFRVEIFAPFFLLRNLRVRTPQAENTPSPAEMLAVVEQSQTLATYLAVPIAAGAGSSMPLVLAQYMHLDFLSTFTPEEQLFALQTALFNSLSVRMTVPEVLALCGSIDASGPRGVPWLQGRARKYSVSAIDMSIKASIERYALVLIADNDETSLPSVYCSGATLLRWCAYRAGGGAAEGGASTFMDATAAAAAAQTAAALGHFSLYRVNTAQHLVDPTTGDTSGPRRAGALVACVNLETVAERVWMKRRGAVPMSCLVPYLRAVVTACEAERDATAGPAQESMAASSFDIIVRAASQVLYAPTPATAAEAPSSLEALLTVYLVLACAVNQRSLYVRVNGQVTPNSAVREWQHPPTAASSASPLTGAPHSAARSVSATTAAILACLCRCTEALRARLEVPAASHEPISDDLRTLLELSIQVEALLPTPVDVTAAPAWSPADASLAELVHRRLYAELQRALAATSLQALAGELSRLPWWVTRRAHASATASAPSWVEALVLDTIAGLRLQQRRQEEAAAAEARKGPMTRRDATPPSPCGDATSAARRFEIYEWTLLPFYAKLAARGDAAAPATTSAAATATMTTTAAAAPLFDEFTAMEDSFTDGAGGASAATGNSGAAAAASLSPAEREAVAVLEAALHALSTQATSLEVLLHVLRQVFLSYPVLLSTAPDAASYFGPRAGVADRPDAAAQQAWATLPVATTELPANLRQQFVHVLYRLFTQAMLEDACGANDLVEWLHLCWLADPRSSRVTAPEVRGAAAAAWPSLYDHCAAYVQSSLEAVAAFEADDDGDEANGSAAGARSVRTARSAAIPALLVTIQKCQRSNLVGVLEFRPRDAHWITVAAAELHPHVVLLVLHSLCRLRWLETRLQVRTLQLLPPTLASPTPALPSSSSSLSVAQRGVQHERVLEVFRPLVLYAASTVETLLDTSKADVLPLLLALTSEVDPQLALDVLQSSFARSSWESEHRRGGGGSGRAGGRGGAPHGRSGAKNSWEDSRRYNVAMGTRKAMAGETAVKGRLGGKVDRSSRGRQRQAEMATSTVMALLLVSSYRQASSAVWAAPGGGGDGSSSRSSSGDGGGVHSALAAGDEHDENETRLGMAGAASGSALTLGVSYYRGVRYLCRVLLRQLQASRVPRLLQGLPASAAAQLLQLSVVEESPRLVRLVEWLLLSMLPQSWQLICVPARRVLEQLVKRVRHGGGGGRGRGFAKALPARTEPLSAALAWQRENKIDPRTLAMDFALVPCNLNTFVVVTTCLVSVRMPLSAEGFQILRRLPLRIWRSLLHRDMVWPPYRGYALGLIQQRKSLIKFDPAGARRLGELKDPVSHWWDSARGSLTSTLVGLDEASIKYLTAAGMGSLHTLHVTSGLLWELGLGFTCLRNNSAVLRDVRGGPRSTSRFGGASARLFLKELVDLPEELDGGARSAAVADRTGEEDELDVTRGCGGEASAAAPLTSYEVLRRYASPDSVLRTPVLQPWLRAACDIVDALASTRHADFLAALAREARWQRETAGAVRDPRLTAEEGPVGFSTMTAVEAAAAEGGPGGRAAGSTDGDAAAAARPLVLDWRPIVNFIRTLRRLDPGMVARQERLEWWCVRAPDSVPLDAAAAAARLSRPHGGFARVPRVLCARSDRDAADEPRDVLHGAINAILRNAQAQWERQAAGDATPPLTMMNLGDVSRVYAGLAAADNSAGVAGASEPSAVSHADGDCVDVARWLAGANAMAADETHVSEVSMLQGGLARAIPALGLPLLAAYAGTPRSTVELARFDRRTRALHRAGVLRSARDVASRARAYGLPCAASLTDARGTAPAPASGGSSSSSSSRGSGDVANFWIAKTRALEGAVVQCIFPTAATSPLATPRAASEDDVQSTRERHARERVQLLRCNDLAWLLLALTRDTSAEALARHDLEVRIVMDTLAEVLPSASRQELVRVVRALLKLCISWSNTAGATSPGAASALQHLLYEARRVLANTAVLLANDVERFTRAEVLWLVSRLHTPRVRPARAADAAVPGRGATSSASAWSQAPLDVSLSLISAAAARALIAALQPLAEDAPAARGARADCDAADDVVEEVADSTAGGPETAASAEDAAVLGVLAALRGASAVEDDGEETTMMTAAAAAAATGPVTVHAWLNAVREAERLETTGALVNVLRMIARSAV